MRKTISVVVAIASSTIVAGAQTSRPIDAGTLATSFGTEEFSIVRNADGGYTLTIISLGGRTMRSTLTTDSLGAPIAYHHHGQGGSAVEKTRTAKKDTSGTLVLLEESSRRPPLSPFRVPPGTFIFDEGGLAQHWFLGLGAMPRDVAFFTPVVQRVFNAPLVQLGPDSVIIEGSAVPASHFVLGTGNTRREIWLDSQKRLLKVWAPPNATAVRTKRPDSTSRPAQR